MKRIFQLEEPARLVGDETSMIAIASAPGRVPSSRHIVGFSKILIFVVLLMRYS